MATPSRSRSSGRGEEDDFEWRQTIEKRQLASERQLKALLQETERLREKNDVLPMHDGGGICCDSEGFHANKVNSRTQR